MVNLPRQKKDFILNPLIITIVLVIALTAAFNFYQNIEKRQQIEAEIEKTEAEIAAAQSDNKKLKQHLKDSSNYEYIEEIARKKLGLVKEGEKLLIPVEEKSETEALDKNKK